MPILTEIKFPEETAEDPFFYLNSTHGLFFCILGFFIGLGGSSLIFSAIFFYAKKIRLKDLSFNILLKVCVLLIPLMFFALLVCFGFNIDHSNFLPYFRNGYNEYTLSKVFLCFILHSVNFTVGFFVSNCLQDIMEDS